MLILGAGLRPMLEDLMDRLSRRLRIEVHDDRKITIYIPEGAELRWGDRQLARVVQQEVVLENNTRAVFTEVLLRVRFTPYTAAITSEPLLLGVIVPASPSGHADIRPPTAEGERVVEFDFISPQSQVTMLVFTNHDGEISFDTLCDREVVVRHIGTMFSESAQKVMPGWMNVLKPIVLPFTIAGIIGRKMRRRERK